MPLIKNSSFNPPFWFRNSHVSTIYPHLIRRMKKMKYQRTRIETPDHDFLDLDFSKVGGQNLMIITHGLEGSSESGYVKGLAQRANREKWDTVALNLRGCSGEPNRLYSSYHSGKTEDLHTVIDYISQNKNYKKIFLVGFSLGGNLTLKYTGEQAENMPQIVAGVVGISVPCQLSAVSSQLNDASNVIYLRRFIRALKKTALEKKRLFPKSAMTEEQINNVKSFADFDGLYTAPAHGFENAQDYWDKCSCRPFLKKIKTKTLLINAQDDPFMPISSYPFEEAEQNPNFYFESPKHGGHVGFAGRLNAQASLWHEDRIIEFLKG